MRLADFIKLDKNEVNHFDFKNMSPSFEVQKELHPVKKFILYKKDYQERLLNRVKEKFDCDRCELVLEIYSKIYSNKDLNNLDLDTMNSFYQTYRLLLLSNDKSFWENDFKTFCNDRGVKPKTIKYNALKLLRYEWLLSEKVFNHYEDINNHPDVMRFATVTHTLGNMTLLPKGFNVGRAIATRDYWDLTLMSLQSFLDRSFDAFVTDYYMEDFIDDKLELWEGHCFEYPLPNSFNKKEARTLSEIEKNSIIQSRIFEFMKNVNGKIENRSERLYKALIVKL
ncbi:hypothetical protein BK740_10585 [Bacillus thuringiensis serovar argentinensis]|nr:hypothetical protein BK740_10585 [Bacillus thuringiensis serovar argentinensis]